MLWHSGFHCCEIPLCFSSFLTTPHLPHPSNSPIRKETGVAFLLEKVRPLGPLSCLPCPSQQLWAFLGCTCARVGWFWDQSWQSKAFRPSQLIRHTENDSLSLIVQKCVWKVEHNLPYSLRYCPGLLLASLFSFGAPSTYTEWFNYVLATLNEKDLVPKVDPILSKGHMQIFHPILTHIILLYFKQFYKLPQILSATRKHV